MNEGRTEVLESLKKELAFLEGDGYKHAPRSPWRVPYIFEDSPSCPNYSERARPHRCEDCWLMQFVAPELHDEQVPCRFVELRANGVTVDSIYRYGTQLESEEALRHWLQERIKELEQQVDAAQKLKRSLP